MSLFLDGLAKVLKNFRSLFLRICVIKIGSPLLSTLANYYAYILKFCVCDHDMPSALKITSKGGFKGGHWKSCPWASKNISPLPHNLWLPNLAEWWLDIRAPTNKITWLFDQLLCEIRWHNKIIITPLPEWLWPSHFAQW